MPNICSVLRNAFFGHNEDLVFEALPGLPREAFGAARASLLVPFAERHGIVPEGELSVPDGAYGMRLRIGNGAKPHEGPWMDQVEPLPTSRGPELKADIVATCMIIGNRYGCCWFAGWLTESVADPGNLEALHDALVQA